MLSIFSPSNRSSHEIFQVTPLKVLQREFFVLFGGLRELLRVFTIPSTTERTDVWNDVLVILREITISLPSVAEKAFDNKDIVFFFSLLSHRNVFDNTMNLLEEILASREETFNLASVPNFFSIIGNFSARQLSHFCRVLSLVLFEPEDRQIMEGSHVLRSLDLLKLRKSRMSRNSSGTVEKNQSLVTNLNCRII